MNATLAKSCNKKRLFKATNLPSQSIPIDAKQGDVASKGPSPNWQAFLNMQQNAQPGHLSKKRKAPNWTKESTKKDLHTADVWFDDVEPDLLERTCSIKNTRAGEEKVREPKKTHLQGSAAKVVKETESSPVLTKHVSLDCEMVGIGLAGKENFLARASIVNRYGECIYDKYVKPSEKVVDYRTEFSGVRAGDLAYAPDYQTVQKEVADILQGRILVGHALHNDLKTLMLSHPRKNIRDTQKYPPFRKLMKTNRPALRKLAKEVLNVTIQDGEHNSVVDAQTAMKLYVSHRKAWEMSLRTKHSKPSKQPEIFLGGVDQTKDKRKKFVKRKWKNFAT